jgi:hypothetical protein
MNPDASKPESRAFASRAGSHPPLSAEVGQQPNFPHHAESQGQVQAPAGPVFEHLDDHTRMSVHMNQRSWLMGWSRMKLSLDEQAGRATGSRMHLEGRVLGVQLSLEEVVTEHRPPARKVWMTVGAPRLLVIGAYRMGFVLVAAGAGGQGAGSEHVTLTVFIDYALPEQGLSRLLGRIFGRWYARWCTQRMVTDAQAAFATAPVGGSARTSL